jgi:23S rRNA (guanosine2251-2'-O)-methyltransferase
VSLHLRNPHSVLAALTARPHDVLEIRLSPSAPSSGWTEVVEAARLHQIPIHTRLPAERRREQRADPEGRHGGCEAVVKERQPRALEEVFPAELAADSQGLWLALDCLQDPQNVGAIFRTAAFFGVNGIVVTRDRSAPLNAAVYDVASGGMELAPFAQPPNLARALEIAKKCGLWILGTSERAEKNITEISRDRPWMLVLGSEEQGLRRLTLELCDDVCRIQPRGELSSLNVSAAAAVLMAELCRSEH